MLRNYSWKRNDLNSYQERKLLTTQLFHCTDWTAYANPGRTSTQGYESVVCNRKSNTTLRQRHQLGQIITWYLILRTRGTGYSTTMDFYARKKICFGLETSITVANDFSHYLIMPLKLINWRHNTVTYSIFMCGIQFFLNTDKLKTRSNITTISWKTIFCFQYATSLGLNGRPLEFVHTH